jgi:hypothetical protein
MEYSEKGTINGIEAEQIFHHIDMKNVDGRYITTPDIKGNYHRDGCYGNRNGLEVEHGSLISFILGLGLIIGFIISPFLLIGFIIFVYIGYYVYSRAKK